ncbi:MAG: sulfotransferase domain-containing protein [Spirochaetales bacterium]|nr:sulfotransferase domain-containing protein [Spirochaetales bacterium]
MKDRLFFIIGCPRSGTTALVKILNLATNAEIFSEQDPKMCIAARMKYENILPYAKDFIRKSKIEMITKAINNNLIYGDKNPNYLFFIREMYELWNCKFIFVLRDGRDVVRSSMDFQKYRGKVYERYEDDGKSIITQPEENYWDFSRIRPKKNERIYKKWRDISKFEKLCWHWNRFNEILLKMIKDLNKKNYFNVFIDKINIYEIENIFNFLALKGFKRKKVEQLLTSKINTVKQNGITKYLDWKHWNQDELDIYNKHCMKMMKRLKYI